MLRNENGRTGFFTKEEVRSILDMIKKLNGSKYQEDYKKVIEDDMGVIRRNLLTRRRIKVGDRFLLGLDGIVLEVSESVARLFADSFNLYRRLNVRTGDKLVFSHREAPEHTEVVKNACTIHFFADQGLDKNEKTE